MEEQKPKAPRKPRTSRQENPKPSSSPKLDKSEIASSETTFTTKPEDTPKVPEEVKPEVTPSVEPDEPIIPDEPEKPTFPIKPEDTPKVPETVKPKSLEEAISPEEVKPKSLEETKAISSEEEEAAMEQEFLEKGKLKVSLYKLNPNLEDGKSKWAFALVVGDLKHIHFKGSFVRAHKWAENYCLSHGLDPKTIQLIKK